MLRIREAWEWSIKHRCEKAEERSSLLPNSGRSALFLREAGLA